ncbi:hypothetical protein RhiirA1_469984 [Rhizophagus irregularis]|uniref:Uncharacterized protein n=1 Tax=Rhizophagus irregularis TaxID=588596 RepID=A0A2I1F2Y5_9GLOM|nr:hypothetical protein RhiirA1_469984 [Rhizophagus irregularis]PKY28733.1 hypothetical protein RhiirB3_445059 [Rhizophagus irregularis]
MLLAQYIPTTLPKRRKRYMETGHRSIALFNSRPDRNYRKFAPLDNWFLMRSAVSQNRSTKIFNPIRSRIEHSLYNDILLPAVYQLQVNYITSENALTVILPVFGASQESNHEGSGDSQLHKMQSCKRSVVYYPKPFEINFIRLKAPNDVATKLGIGIDKNSSHEITRIASLAKTVGAIYDLPITIGQGKNELTISDEFLVFETERDKNRKDKSLIILGVPWQYKAG